MACALPPPAGGPPTSPNRKPSRAGVSTTMDTRLPVGDQDWTSGPSSSRDRLPLPLYLLHTPLTFLQIIATPAGMLTLP